MFNSHAHEIVQLYISAPRWYVSNVVVILCWCLERKCPELGTSPHVDVEQRRILSSRLTAARGQYTHTDNASVTVLLEARQCVRARHRLGYSGILCWCLRALPAVISAMATMKKFSGSKTFHPRVKLNHTLVSNELPINNIIHYCS